MSRLIVSRQLAELGTVRITARPDPPLHVVPSLQVIYFPATGRPPPWVHGWPAPAAAVEIVPGRAQVSSLARAHAAGARLAERARGRDTTRDRRRERQRQREDSTESGTPPPAREGRGPPKHMRPWPGLPVKWPLGPALPKSHTISWRRGRRSVCACGRACVRTCPRRFVVALVLRATTTCCSTTLLPPRGTLTAANFLHGMIRYVLVAPCACAKCGTPKPVARPAFGTPRSVGGGRDKDS